MNAHVDISAGPQPEIFKSDLARMRDQESRREFVLASLRVTRGRLHLIMTEIDAIGAALKEGFISPDLALEWAEEVAPGCIGFIPITARGTFAEGGA
jgi:hypothetical protein